MQSERGYVLESRFVHGLLLALGTVLFVIAMLQLPLSVYFQNTKPAYDWRRIEMKAEGAVILPVKGEVPGPFHGLIKDMDVLVDFDGVPMDSANHKESAVWKKLNSHSIGDTIRLEIIRDGEPMTLTGILTVSRSEFYGSQISNIQYLTYNVAPLVTVLIALVILVRQRRRRLSSMFALVAYSIGFYLLVVSQISAPMPWWKWMDPYLVYVSQIVLYFFFALLLHFLAIFPFERKVFGSETWRNVLIYLPPVVFSAIIIVLFWVMEIITQEGWLENSLIAYFILYPIIGVGLLVSSYRRAVSPAIKKVVTVLGMGVGAFGLSSALILILGYFITDLGEQYRIWIRVVLLISLTFSLPVSFGYAILRYGFMDVRIIVKQATVYVILSGIVISGFLGMYLMLLAYEGKFTQSDTLFISLVVSGLLLLAITILKDRIQDFVSRRIFKRGYEIARRLDTLARRLLHFLEQDALVKHLCAELPATLELNSGSIVEIKNGKARLLCGVDVQKDKAGDILAHANVRRKLTEGDVVVVNAQQGMPFHEDVHVIFGIEMSDDRDVVMILGEKTSGKPYSDEELEQLHRIADHAALGWRNASVTEELKDRERIKKEVEIAQTIQMSLLPHGMPQVPGVDLAAYSTPAREVGGDFYDMLPLMDGRMLVSVGDVSDKGISAAMVMASAISTLRYASEMFATPKAMLESANRRLYYDTRKQMFVAVLTAMVDPVQHTLTFTNAGLPLPLLYRDGEAFSIVWSDNGEHLPLGAKEDTFYHEQTIELQRGDIILLYTDGVIESVNDDDEEFGVKRLKQAIERSDDLPCERILQNIHDDIHAFTGTKAHFDDITMVCLRIV